MENGIKLASESDIKDLSSTLNICYVIAIIGAIFLKGNFLIIVFFLFTAFQIKSMILDKTRYKFRKMEFWMPEDLTLEDIQVGTAQILATNDIYVILEQDNLQFKHDAITYEFILEQNGTFRLYWSYTIKKALFSNFTDIKDYKTLRKDTALIAYVVQNMLPH